MSALSVVRPFPGTIGHSCPQVPGGIKTTGSRGRPRGHPRGTHRALGIRGAVRQRVPPQHHTSRTARAMARQRAWTRQRHPLSQETRLAAAQPSGQASDPHGMLGATGNLKFTTWHPNRHQSWTTTSLAHHSTTSHHSTNSTAPRSPSSWAGGSDAETSSEPLFHSAPQEL